jgi:hypothetical protein
MYNYIVQHRQIAAAGGGGGGTGVPPTPATGPGQYGICPVARYGASEQYLWPEKADRKGEGASVAREWEFNLERTLREKHAKIAEFKRKFANCLNVFTYTERPKIAEF